MDFKDLLGKLSQGTQDIDRDGKVDKKDGLIGLAQMLDMQDEREESLAIPEPFDKYDIAEMSEADRAANHISDALYRACLITVGDLPEEELTPADIARMSAMERMQYGIDADRYEECCRVVGIQPDEDSIF